jgi:DNA-binding NarL/FixJ family response regulator
MAGKIQVLLVDDHALFAEAIVELLRLQPDIAVVGTASTGTDAVRSAVEMNPDVVLMDHFMPDINGTEATRLIRARCPGTRILMVSASSDATQIAKALHAGAHGFLAKWCGFNELVTAIREVHAGRRYVQPELAAALLHQLLDSEGDHDALAQLSPRERQVLQRIAEGQGAAEIASALSLSVRTVETYRARLMEKLAIRDVPALVKFAIRHGLTSLE